MTVARNGRNGRSRAFSPYLEFSRDEWAMLRASTPMTLAEGDLETLRGINEQLSMDEVQAIYLPLSRLLNLYVAASQALHTVTDIFMGRPAPSVPYVIGIAGSVAVGKSTTARILQALLARWPNHPTVDLVTTDGFLYPNRVLEERGILNRKGFPESYDRRRLLDFVAGVKGGRESIRAPVYSHLVYDLVPDEFVDIRGPDIVIVEGLNVLQTPAPGARRSQVYVSDFFDFSIYVDAAEADIEAWYVERFLTLRSTAFRSRESYFHRYSELTDAEAESTARGIWKAINGVNLRENIEPTRDRARLIIRKDRDHSVSGVRLRKL